MNGEIGFQIFILVLAAFVLVRAILKLPKKLAIGFFIFFSLSIVTIVFMAFYFTEAMIIILELLRVD